MQYIYLQYITQIKNLQTLLHNTKIIVEQF